MQFQVKYDSSILWRGKTEFHEYTLHRALIISADEGWLKPGYALFAKSPAESNLAEAYVDDQIEPGNGLYGDMIAVAEATDKPLPEPDRRDIVEFATLFAELCESGEAPLIDSEILV